MDGIEAMLVGDTVLLRPVEDEDLPLLVEWRNRPDIWRCFLNKFPINRSGQTDWLKRLQADTDRQLFILCRNEDRKPVGSMGFDRIDACNQHAEIGNVMIGDASAAGKGYAREALLLLLEYGFLRLNLHRIHLRVLARNERAVRLYESCGFRVEGCLRQMHFDEGAFHDILCMGLLRAEYGAD